MKYNGWSFRQHLFTINIGCKSGVWWWGRVESKGRKNPSDVCLQVASSCHWAREMEGPLVVNRTVCRAKREPWSPSSEREWPIIEQGETVHRLAHRKMWHVKGHTSWWPSAHRIKETLGSGTLSEYRKVLVSPSSAKCSESLSPWLVRMILLYFYTVGRLCVFEGPTPPAVGWYHVELIHPLDSHQGNKTDNAMAEHNHKQCLQRRHWAVPGASEKMEALYSTTGSIGQVTGKDLGRRERDWSEKEQLWLPRLPAPWLAHTAKQMSHMQSGHMDSRKCFLCALQVLGMEWSENQGFPGGREDGWGKPRDEWKKQDDTVSLKPEGWVTTKLSLWMAKGTRVLRWPLCRQMARGVSCGTDTELQWYRLTMQGPRNGQVRGSYRGHL